MRRSTLLAISDQIYRRLLRVYPAGFRREYGAPMAQVFHDCCRAALEREGISGLARVWLVTLRDLAATVPLEHLAAVRKLLCCRMRPAWARLPDIGRRGVRMLHITNGDSTVRQLQQAGLPGQVIAWKDVLHEGPAPAGLSLDQLRALRARFIADQGWASYEDVLDDFLRRDSALEQFQMHKEVVLWFEHDLYDQLQLIQLLDWFARHELGATRLSLICIGEFPGVASFHGLGELSSAQLAGLYPARAPVTQAQLALGSAAWQAFRSPDPTAIEALLGHDTTALPYLRAALIRHLEQFPDAASGLSRTERQILQAVAAGKQTLGEIFFANQAGEESPFMGDSTLWSYVQALCVGDAPLLASAAGGAFALPAAFQRHADFLAQALVLTERGRAVLAGRADRLRGVDRWLGGVHLRGEMAWRWDSRRGRLVGAASSPG
jgi:uncharacterized protein DUF1835